MIKYYHQFFEDYCGCHYEFEECGDAIPMHQHIGENAELQHNVSVLKGSVRVNERVVKKGEVYDFDSSEWHEIVALEPGTHILNVYTEIPGGYLQLDKTLLTGEIRGTNQREQAGHFNGTPGGVEPSVGGAGTITVREGPGFIQRFGAANTEAGEI